MFSNQILIKKGNLNFFGFFEFVIEFKFFGDIVLIKKHYFAFNKEFIVEGVFDVDLIGVNLVLVD